MFHQIDELKINDELVITDRINSVIDQFKLLYDMTDNTNFSLEHKIIINDIKFIFSNGYLKSIIVNGKRYGCIGEYPNYFICEVKR